MIFSWFDSSEARAFGISLARVVIEKLPLEADEKKKRFAARAAQVLVKLTQQIDQFKGKHRLNVYKKAKLGNAFKWTLRDAGYDTVYVDELTEWLMLRL